MPGVSMSKGTEGEAMARKLVSLILILGLVAGLQAASAQAGKKKTRKAQGTYSAPASVIGGCRQHEAIGCVEIPTGPKERFVTARVTDAHGLPVVVVVMADLDGGSTIETRYGRFCGETDKPIEIEPGKPVIFWVGSATDATASCVPGVGTQGTVDVTFST